MKWPFSVKEKALLEAYNYFDQNIRKLPRNNDGSFKESSSEFYNNDVDAFRHAYVSAIFTLEFDEKTAEFFGRLNEFFNFSSEPGDFLETNMDLWNNAVGREKAAKIRSRGNLLKTLHQALKSDELIQRPQDTRTFKGSGMILPSKTRPVVTIKQNITGRNILFCDTAKSKIMNVKQFIFAINNGEYPGYHVKRINGVYTPISKPDGNPGGNLG